MRVRTVALSCLLVAASVGGAKTLAAASPDCARWIKQYQQGLARNAVLAKKHVVKAAQHLVIPRPHLRLASTSPGRFRPAKLSPAEMLKRFKVLCGEDLPDDVLPVAFVPTGLEDTMIPGFDTPDQDIVAGLTGNEAPTPFVPNSGPPTGTPPPNGVVTNGGGGTPGGGGTGGLPGTPIIPPTPVIPSPVPEPGTLVLLLTGLATMPVMLRYRRKPPTV